MALKQTDKEKIKSFGFDIDKLIEAIKADAEVDYPVPDIVALTPAQLEERDNNIKAAERKAGESEGEKKGKELLAKTLCKKFGIEETIKDGDKLGEVLQTKLSTGDQALKDQITLLQGDKQTLQTKLQEQEQRAAAAAFDAELISLFPSNRTGELTDAERLALVKMNLQFEEADGKRVVKKGGEILRDKNTQSPLDAKQVITDLFTEKKWTGAPPTGGRGGHDNPPPAGGSGSKTFSGAKSEWKKLNPNGNELSPECTAYVNEQAKANPDFNWYE